MHKSFVRLVRGSVALFALAAVVILSGCQTTNYAGSGPLTLGPNTSAYFQQYLNDRGKAAFAVSPGGGCAVYFQCPAVAGACVQNDTQFFTLRSCKDRCNTDCKILAVRSRVVWEGPVTDSNNSPLN